MNIEKEFNIKNLNYYIRDIKGNFESHFYENGYVRHDSAPLISFNDHTVRFTGSTTNVFKSYIVSEKIPNDGFFLIQECLRTQNAKFLLDDSILPKWSSYFTAMGVIARPDKLALLYMNTAEYLLKLGIKPNKIKIKVYSKDSDLVACIKSINYGFNIELDDCENESSYRHKYGLSGVSGRNFNFAILNKESGKFNDIGNIVLIEKLEKPIAVELGIGVSTLISCIYSLNSSIESSLISKIVPFAQGIKGKFADAISSSVVIMRQGIGPGSRDRERILKTYLNSLTYFREKLYLTIEDIIYFAGLYEKEEFGDKSNIPEQIKRYLYKYESGSHESEIKNKWEGFLL